MTQIIKKVGPYRLTRRIGSGATSEVFQALKQGDHHKYAMKMIRLNKITQGQKQMITKQISIIKGISHPNIVKLEDSLETTNNFYLVFEFCQKGDLQKYLREYYGPLIPQQAVQKIFFCIGDAIREIHSKGIVHRDIKLANILLKRDLCIKLADFGFAKQINEQQFMLKTYCGTPITMAPQILQSKLYDRKCDIWSLGVILFQLVYGKLPFAINQGYNKFVERVVKQPLKIPSQPQMPQQFKDLLSKCLQKNPQNRYSIEDFMASPWIIQGKDKKLEQRNIINDPEVTTVLKDNSYENQEKLREEEEIQRNQIIQKNTAQKLYKLLRNQMQKILQNHQDLREEIYQKILKTYQSNELSQISKKQFNKLERLVYFLDFKYLQFLKELQIPITKDSDEVKIKIADLNNLEFPDFLYISKNKEKQNKVPEVMPFGQTVQNFLKNQTDQQNSSDTLQKRKQRYLIIDKLFPMLRRFDLSVDILFSHHFQRQQINLDNVLHNLMQMGKHVSESTIQEPCQVIEGQQKRVSQIEQKPDKYDKNSNFITLSMECKQKNQKIKQFRESLKQTGERMIDQITKTMQGYYN